MQLSSSANVYRTSMVAPMHVDVEIVATPVAKRIKRLNIQEKGIAMIGRITYRKIVPNLLKANTKIWKLGLFQFLSILY